MPLNINNPQVDVFVNQLTALTGESKTKAVEKALVERIEQFQAKQSKELLRQRVQTIIDRCAALPTMDNRCAEDILGYGADGTPQ